MCESLFHEQGAIIIYKLKASNNNIALTATNAVNTSQAIACDVFTALVTAFVAVNAMFVPIEPIQNCHFVSDVTECSLRHFIQYSAT